MKKYKVYVYLICVIVIVLFAWSFYRVGWYARSVPQIVKLPNYRVHVIPDFLTCRECGFIQRQALSKGLQISQVQTGNITETDTDHRASEQVWLSDGHHPFFRALSERVALLTQTNAKSQEQLQVVRYQPGGRFNEHYDAFAEGVPFWSQQRYLTLLIYLNEPEEGGETVFPRIGKTVRPVTGTAVLFQNTDHPTTQNIIWESLHAGRPVRRGEKWIANKWIDCGS